MGVFSKKKKKNVGVPPRPTTNVPYDAPVAAAVHRLQPSKQVIKIVGDEKHITTERIDSQGRKVMQTQVVKLTDSEKQQFGIGQPDVASTEETPPAQQQEQYQPPSPATTQLKSPPPSAAAAAPPSNSTNGGMMKTPMDSPSDAGGTHVTNISFGDESMARIEITRELVKKFISDIWNRGEVEMIPQVCHPSLRFNGHVGMDRVGHDGFARMVTTVREALTDYHCEIHSMVVESNKAFCRLRFTGKHTGNLLGYPPTGKTVSWMGASEFTCKNGKILKVWELGDVKSLEDQLRSTD